MILSWRLMQRVYVAPAGETPTFMIQSDATIVAPLLFAVVLGL